MGGYSTTPIPLLYHWACLVAHTDSTVTLAVCTSPPQAQARHNLNMEREVGSMFTCIFELKMRSLVPATNLAMALVPEEQGAFIGVATLH